MEESVVVVVVTQINLSSRDEEPKIIESESEKSMKAKLKSIGLYAWRVDPFFVFGGIYKRESCEKWC